MNDNDKSRLIIENRTNLSMLDIMHHVIAVLRMGRISNDEKQYCYVSTFADGIVIASDLNDKSDRLVVYQQEPTNE